MLVSFFNCLRPHIPDPQLLCVVCVMMMPVIGQCRLLRFSARNTVYRLFFILQAPNGEVCVCVCVLTMSVIHSFTPTRSQLTRKCSSLRRCMSGSRAHTFVKLIALVGAAYHHHPAPQPPTSKLTLAWG